MLLSIEQVRSATENIHQQQTQVRSYHQRVKSDQQAHHIITRSYQIISRSRLVTSSYQQITPGHVSYQHSRQSAATSDPQARSGQVTAPRWAERRSLGPVRDDPTPGHPLARQAGGTTARRGSPLETDRGERSEHGRRNVWDTGEEGRG